MATHDKQYRVILNATSIINSTGQAKAAEAAGYQVVKINETTCHFNVTTSGLDQPSFATVRDRVMGIFKNSYPGDFSLKEMYEL